VPRIGPTCGDHDSEQDDIGPVEQQRCPICDVFAEHRGGERHDGGDRQEQKSDPGQVAVAARQMVELGLLPDPEDAEGGDAEQPDQEARPEVDKRADQIVFAVDGIERRGGIAPARLSPTAPRDG